jgi:hypothetical protein
MKSFKEYAESHIPPFARASTTFNRQHSVEEEWWDVVKNWTIDQCRKWLLRNNREEPTYNGDALPDVNMYRKAVMNYAGRVGPDNYYYALE